MPTLTTAITFAEQVATPAEALAQAQLVVTALQTGVVEDSTGRSTGFAQDTIYRFFLKRPLLALERDREQTLEVLHALGSVRGYRIASACAEHTDAVGASLYWENVADQLFTEAQSTVAA